MVDFAEDGHEPLPGIGHINHVVAPQPQIGERAPRINKGAQLHGHHLAAAAINGALVGNLRAFVRATVGRPPRVIASSSVGLPSNVTGPG